MRLKKKIKQKDGRASEIGNFDLEFLKGHRLNLAIAACLLTLEKSNSYLFCLRNISSYLAGDKRMQERFFLLGTIKLRKGEN